MVLNSLSLPGLVDAASTIFEARHFYGIATISPEKRRRREREMLPMTRWLVAADWLATLIGLDLIVLYVIIVLSL